MAWWEVDSTLFAQAYTEAEKPRSPSSLPRRWHGERRDDRERKLQPTEISATELGLSPPASGSFLPRETSINLGVVDIGYQGVTW